MKDNADFKIIEELIAPRNIDLLSDQLIQFTGFYAQKNCPHVLRRIVVWDNQNDREIVLLTNHLKFGATTISPYLQFTRTGGKLSCSLTRSSRI
jgi:hypothetical protein